MIAIRNDGPPVPSDWQTGLLALFPEIQQRLCQAFAYQAAAARDEAIADGILLCVLSYKRLNEQGRAQQVTAASLAWYAAKQVRSGRGEGCRLNSQEPLALYAQRRRAFRKEPLEPSARTWIDALVQDRRSSVLDHVAARLDVAAWLSTLGGRTRHMVEDLARGCTTSEVARKYGLTAGRISQLRRELKNSWHEFQHEPVGV
jgi:hypothetical protein